MVIFSTLTTVKTHAPGTPVNTSAFRCIACRSHWLSDLDGTFGLRFMLKFEQLGHEVVGLGFRDFEKSSDHIRIFLGVKRFQKLVALTLVITKHNMISQSDSSKQRVLTCFKPLDCQTRILIPDGPALDVEALQTHLQQLSESLILMRILNCSLIAFIQRASRQQLVNIHARRAEAKFHVRSKLWILLERMISVLD